MMVYLPTRQLLYTSDLFAPDGNGGWFTPQYLHEFIGAVEREHLAVKTIFGMHYDPTDYQTVVAYTRAFTVASPTAPSPGAQQPAGALPGLMGTWSCAGSFPSSGKPMVATMSFEAGLTVRRW